MKKSLFSKVNIIFIIIEIVLSIALIYGMSFLLQNEYLKFPKSIQNELFLGIILILSILFIINYLILIVLSKLNEKRTNVKFNYVNGTLYLIIGIILSFGISSFLISTISSLSILNSENENYITGIISYVLILMGYSLSIIGFNYGLRNENNNNYA